MPIPKHLRNFYGKVWRTVTRPRILKRAADRCERCKVPNRQTVLRSRGWWLDLRVSWAEGITRTWRNHNGEAMGPRRPRGMPRIRRIRIVLTIAHLDQTPGNDRDENLCAMCQWCHLTYDRGQHLVNGKSTRCDRKDSERPILQALQP